MLFRSDGTVRYSNGDPVTVGEVTVTQQYRGFSQTFTSSLDGDGTYRIEALPGEAQVAVRAGMLRDARTVELSTSGPRTEDFTVIGPRTYDVELRLLTSSGGMHTETGPIPLDWRTVVNLGVNPRVTGDRKSTRLNSSHSCA